MTVPPLVTRELQAEGGRAFNYWLRVLGAGSVIVALTAASLSWQLAPAQYGPVLFRSWPVIGLYFSLPRMNFLVAWLFTCVVGLLLPPAVMLALANVDGAWQPNPSIACGLQALLACGMGHQLCRNLSGRHFVFTQP